MDIKIAEVFYAIGGILAGWVFNDFMKGVTNDAAERIGQTIRGHLRKKTPITQIDEYFRIGNYTTSLHIIDGNGSAKYLSSTIDAVYSDGAPDSPHDIADRILKKEQEMEAARQSGNSKVWDGIGVGIKEYHILRSDDEKHLKMAIQLYKSRYAAFQATVIEIGSEDRADPNSIYQKHLSKHEPQNLIPYLARNVGIVAVVITKDDWVILCKRGEMSAVRKGEYDASVVEGIEPIKDADSTNMRQRINIFQSIARGCSEELGFTPSFDEINILGFGVDMRFYQYNFICTIHSRLTLDDIKSDRNGTAIDKWETRLFALKYGIDEVLEFINENKMWAFAMAALYWALLEKHLPIAVEARAKQIVVRSDNYVP